MPGDLEPMSPAISYIAVLGSPIAGWLLLIAISFVILHLFEANCRVRAQVAEMQAKCAEHEQTQRESAALAAGEMNTARVRLQDLQLEVDEAQMQIGESDLRVAQLQNQVDALLRDRADIFSSKEEISASLRSNRISLSFSRAECLRTEEAAKSAHVEKDVALQQLSNERQISNNLRNDILRLTRQLNAAQIRLSRHRAEANDDMNNSPHGSNCSDDIAIKRTAELMVSELPRSPNPSDRQRAQRQLLTCLHPDKCPSNRVATMLMQEVQRSADWVAATTLGGA
jgi:chromosome segregation ATPase